MLLIDFTEINAEHKTWPKISKNCMKSPLFVRRAKKPQQKPSTGARSKRAVPSSLEYKKKSYVHLLTCYFMNTYK